MKTISQPQQFELFKPIQPGKKNNFPCEFTFVDLFAGIGGFRIPFEQLGGQCLGYSEIDKEAIKVYQNNFLRAKNSEEKNLGNVQNIDSSPFELDLIVGGVPCQPWSIAGKSKGFEDSRGTLWFDVIRLVNSNKPKSFIFENVKGLTEPRNKYSLTYIINNLELAGYAVNFQVLNSYDFGLSQDRDRIFIVGIRKDLEYSNDFNFPEPLTTNPKLYQFIEKLDKSSITKQKFNPHLLFIVIPNKN